MIIVLLLLETARKSKQVLFGEIPKSINIMFGFISRYLEALVEIYTAIEYIKNEQDLLKSRTMSLKDLLKSVQPS